MVSRVVETPTVVWCGVEWNVWMFLTFFGKDPHHPRDDAHGDQKLLGRTIAFHDLINSGGEAKNNESKE